jgi:fructan beta-fructosidase
MRILKSFFTISFFLNLLASSINAQVPLPISEPLYRPVIHFTPQKAWMNDPNGMFYKDGTYHLYYQYYPNATVWGPMHWGHATSKNLLNWKQEPIALYPDSVGMIFSGSAVVDHYNTSGFGNNGKAPIVAIFTQHDMKGEKSGKVDFQNQSIAYSNDGGTTWKKYEGNPVLRNPGIKDFRDPKVIWHEASKKWVMILAVKDKVSLYTSKNLKQWEKASDFGMNLGNHGGVWECPDLFPMVYQNKTYWVLTVSVNPGGPNKGSATQYFVGNFDGTQFTTNSQQTKWIDYGADNYASVTWSNTGNKRISIGWMSNWLYAQQVPTENWRSACTLARDLGLQEVNGEFYLTSNPVKGIPFSTGETITSLTKSKATKIAMPCKISLPISELHDFSIQLSNSLGELLIFGYDSSLNRYFIDRTLSGKSNFHPDFAAKHFAPRISIAKTMNMEIVLDKASIELFADNGLTVMTDIFFPSAPYTSISIQSNNEQLNSKILYSRYLTP